jgi:hypothetical protein
MENKGNAVVGLFQFISWMKAQPFYIKFNHDDEKLGIKSVERLDLMCNENTPMDLEAFKESFFKFRNTEPLFLRLNERERIKVTAKNIRTYFKKLFLRDSQALKSSRHLYSLYMISNYTRLIYFLLTPVLLMRWIYLRLEFDPIFKYGIILVIILFIIYYYTNHKFKDKLCESVQAYNTRFMRPHRFS